MKIRHVSSFSDAGGATIAAKRFSNALIKAGYDSKFIGIQKKRGSLYSKFLSFCDRLPLRLYRNRVRVPFSVGLIGTFSGFTSIIASKNTIVNLHWMNGGVFSLFFLAVRRRPILWTLHDMWPVTGGCHYSFSCERYVVGCGYCPLLKSNRRRDITFWMIRLKKILLKNVIFIAPSKWMLSVATESFVHSSQSTIIVRNVHTGIEKTRVDAEAKIRTNDISVGQDTILFVADSLDDKLKGSDYLEPLIAKILHQTQLNIVIVGKLDVTARSNVIEHPRVTCLGYIKAEKMQYVYSNATCLVTLSIQENFSNVIAEAMYADLPVIGFNIGGNPDLIIHKVTGYLVEKRSIDDLIDAIMWIIKNKQNLENWPRRHISELCQAQPNISNYIRLIRRNTT